MNPTPIKKAQKGFAVMRPKDRIRIARMGGLAVSENSKHMAKIGRIGGSNSHRGDSGRTAAQQPKGKK